MTYENVVLCHTPGLNIYCIAESNGVRPYALNLFNDITKSDNALFIFKMHDLSFFQLLNEHLLCV